MNRPKLFAALILVGSLAGAFVLATSLLGDAKGTKSSIVVWFVLGIIVVGALGLALHFFRKTKSYQVNQGPEDYRHAYPLVAILLAAAAVALIARPYLVPATFGEFGHYRGDAQREAMRQTPKHVGQSVCAECHDDKASLHDKDAHATVPCETCHGPGAQHAETNDKKDILVPQGKESCMICHRQLISRPGDFPQVNSTEHYKRVGVKDDSIKCTQCHDPHEPLFMDRDLRSARLHPIIHRCRDCHKGKMRDTAPKPPSHPPIFECHYCHKQLTEDFKARTHAKLECTTCHKFFKESDYAGRIIRDADPRFCLLCHQGGAFRADTAPPSIDWPSHRDDMSAVPEDSQKICIDCHRENLHLPQSQLAPTAPISATDGGTEGTDVH